jgi:hypothetical protein
MSRDRKGRFEKGPDPQRHQFTQAECGLGYRTAVRRGKLHRILWLLNHVRCYYRKRHPKTKRKRRKPDEIHVPRRVCAVQ